MYWLKKWGFEGTVDTMCNLSVGIYERGWNEAWNEAWNACRTEYLQKEQEQKKLFISKLLKMHMDIPEIAQFLECPEEEVRLLVKEMGL